MSTTERNRYAFYHGTGAQARLSNSHRSAERLLAGMEFQNAVVISDRPLDDGKPFEVIMEKKVSTWSGSVIVGATTTPPENFTFPANLSCLTSNCWVVNGKSLFKNGYRKIPEYAPQLLEALTEGSTVGVVKRGRGLHFMVNGSVLSAAEEALPPNSKVWALIDLYGQCSKVSVLGCESRQSSPEGAADPLLFHSRCGKLAQIMAGGTAACRKGARHHYDDGVVISNRALKDDELFEVEIVDMYHLWSGSIELGVTTHNPEEIDFPSTLTNATSGTWIMSSGSVIHNGITIEEHYTSSLDALKVGDRVGLMRRSNGSLVYFINGVDQGVAATNIPRHVYAVVDIYGQCSQIKLTNSPQQAPDTPSSAEESPRTNQREDCPSGDEGRLRFNSRCGENAVVKEAGRLASRKDPDDEYTGASVLTNRTLKPGEMFEVKIDSKIESWSGSLQMGVCQVDPDMLDFEDFEEITDLCLPSWILSGSDIYEEGMSSDADYPLDLDALPEGSKVSVKVTSDGDLHFFVNEADMGVAASGLPSEGLYGCLEIYGSCTQVSIVDHHDNVAQNHMTYESSPSISLEDRVSSTAGSSSNAGEKSEVISLATGRHQFHQVHGRYIRLSKEKTVAKRLQGFDEGLLFSSQPLQPGEVFEVELTELSTRAWQGGLRVGLVSKLPKLLPKSISELGEGSWVVVGSSLVSNGSSVRQDLAIGQQLQLKVGSHLSVWFEEDGWMHVAVDGADLGPLLPHVTKLPHAVVDLYGGAISVRINDNCGAREEETASSSDMSVQWSAECGSHVQLSRDYLQARRAKSYSNGVVLSSKPLPNSRLFQCVLKELDRSWDGTLSLGITSLAPRHACLAEKAQELKKRSYVLCTQAKVTRLFVGGKEVCRLPDVSLGSVQEGGTVGILCESHNRTLHFYINHTHLEIKLPEGDVRLPSNRYALVDLYGQCRSVELKPLLDLHGEVKDADVSISLSVEDLSHVRKHKHRHQVGGAKQEVPHPPDHQIPPDNFDLARSVEEREEERITPNSGAVSFTPPPPTSYQDCDYYKLAKAFLSHLPVPVEYLSTKPEYSKCYCDNCLSLWGEPDVKISGDPQKKYAVPRGWVKFGLRLTFEPQAQQHQSFKKWHKCYHGTAPGRVRPILDHGGLLLPGSCLLGGEETVKQPPGHYTEKWKPANHDPKRIFVSPSIKYCSFKDVYTKKYRFSNFDGSPCEGRVCFKVLIDPRSYDVAEKTIATKEGEVIDENFSDSELEWSTKSDRAVYVYGLMVQVDRPKPS